MRAKVANHFHSYKRKGWDDGSLKRYVVDSELIMRLVDGAPFNAGARRNDFADTRHTQ